MIMCPICTAPSSFAFNARFVKVHRCQNEDCGHLFAVDTKPFAGVHDYEYEMKLDFSQYRHRNNRLIRYWKSAGFLKPHFRVLDFGSGTGHILASLKEQMPELDITAIEMNESYHPNLKRVGAKVHRDLNDIPAGETFDAILMIEVLEHLDNPLGILSALRSRLNRGGKFFLTTPAGDLRSPYETKWDLPAYEHPHHVQFFTEKSLKYCLKKAGFTNMNYRYIHELYPDRQESGWKARMHTLKMYYAFRKGYVNHLTYFVS